MDGGLGERRPLFLPTHILVFPCLYQSRVGNKTEFAKFSQLLGVPSQDRLSSQLL